MTDVVNACLLWCLEQTHTLHITHHVPTVRQTVTIIMHHCAFIPVDGKFIVTEAAASAAAAATSAAQAEAATPAIATVAVSATGYRLPIITS